MKTSKDNRFNDLLDKVRELHDKKAQDYGDDEDQFANIRASEQFGVPAWEGAMIRLNDKVHRLARFAKKKQLANESAEDSMMDIAVYALIALILYREEPDNPPALGKVIPIPVTDTRPKWLRGRQGGGVRQVEMVVD